MTEFDDLFAEWGTDGDGEPLTLTLQPYVGTGADGDVYGPAEPVPGLPREFSRRLVRTSQGDEAVATLTVFAPHPIGARFALGSLVTVEGHTGAVLVQAHHRGGDLGDYDEIAVE